MSLSNESTKLACSFNSSWIAALVRFKLLTVEQISTIFASCSAQEVRLSAHYPTRTLLRRTLHQVPLRENQLAIIQRRSSLRLLVWPARHMSPYKVAASAARGGARCIARGTAFLQSGSGAKQLGSVARA